MNINLYAYAQAFNIDWARVRLSAAQDPVVALATPYTGYVSECTFTSSAYDTGGTRTGDT